jgi:hypothetical protein
MSGCSDNAAILRKLEDLARRKGSKLYLLFVDFRNAFGAPDHKVIWLILRWLNVPEYIIKLLINVYDGAEVKFRCGENELTQAIRVLCGVLQGDVVSPSVFLCVADMLLRLFDSVEEEEGEIMFDAGETFSNEAYADDTLAASLTKSKMLLLVDMLEVFENVTGVQVNAEKSAATVISFRANGSRTTTNPKLVYGKRREEISGLNGAETYLFLGAEAAGTGNHRVTQKRLTETLERKGQLLRATVCLPAIKSSLFQRFVVPKLSYSLSIWTLPAASLAKLDRRQRYFARHFELLRPSHCNAQVHASSCLGGFGFTSFFNLSMLSFTRPSLKRGLIADSQVQASHWDSIRAEAVRLSPADPLSLMLYPWRFVAVADKKTPRDLLVPLTALAAVGVSYSMVANRATLHSVSDKLSLFQAINQVGNKLKALKVSLELREWQKKTLEGELMRVLTEEEMAPAASQAVHMQHPFSFTPQERLFAAQCQSNNIMHGANAKRWFKADPKCNLCNAPTESTFHVLNHCDPRVNKFYTPRHDAALCVLYTAFSTPGMRRKRVPPVSPIEGMYPAVQVMLELLPQQPASYVSRKPPHTSVLLDMRTELTTKRPDLQVFDGDDPEHLEEAAFVDMKTSFPSRIERFAEVHRLNMEKYTPETLPYRAMGVKSDVHTIIIPSTGLIPKHTYSTLVTLGFRKNLIPKLIRNMCIAATKANYKLRSTLNHARNNGYTPSRSAPNAGPGI